MQEDLRKYLFDPNNPKECKAYKLLIRVAKSKPSVFFSPNILRYLLKDKLSILIKEELWDVPENYDDLSILEKLKLYEKQYSHKELLEFLEKKIEEKSLYSKVFQYSFINNFLDIYIKSDLLKFYVCSKNEFDEYLKDYLIQREEELIDNYFGVTNNYIDHAIFFTDNILDVLELKVERSSVVVTLKENMDKFFEKNTNTNIKPIFLEKIEDLDILLNVLEHDLHQQNIGTFVNENITYLKEINIKNFYSLQNVFLDLKDKKEIYIVGENGDGKTLFLQALIIGTVGVKDGEVFELVKNQKNLSISIKDNQDKIYTNENKQEYKYILGYGASRYSFCQIKEDKSGYLSLFSSEYDLKDPVEWLKYLDYKQKNNEISPITIDEIKYLLQDILNKDINIFISPDEVIFEEKKSKVSFEQLSSGYKGVITLVCDIISRLFEKEQNITSVGDLKGVVLIDEIDLHLHPKWKYRFLRKLREILPKVQFIVTTHSMSIILGASKDALFVRTYKENGVIKLKSIKEATNDYIIDIQNEIFGFDINKERLNKKQNQKEAKESLLNMISNIDKV